jgi:hypothetical protein
MKSPASDGGEMEPLPEQKDEVESSRAPRIGVRLMIVILVGLTLVAIYANVQKARRDNIEQAALIPVVTATPATPSPER